MPARLCTLTAWVARVDGDGPALVTTSATGHQDTRHGVVAGLVDGATG
jgi:hypothetical protein